MAMRRRGAGIDTRSVLIGLLALVVLAGAVAILLALRSGAGRTQQPTAPEEEPALDWRVSLPPGWAQSPIDAAGVRFLLDGLLAGGLEVLDVEGGGFAAVIPEHARIEGTWVAATRWGQAVAYEVSVPLTEPDDTQALVMQLTGAAVDGGGAEPGGRRPETHCILQQGSRAVHLWTRENAGFGPLAAGAAAVNLLASLEPADGSRQAPTVPATPSEPTGPTVRLVRIAPATTAAEVSGAFDVQIVVTNGSDVPAVGTRASLGVESMGASPAVQLLPARVETIGSLAPGQSVMLVASAVKLPDGVANGTAFRAHAEIVPQAPAPGGSGSGVGSGSSGLELTITAAPAGQKNDTAGGGE